jgi:inorganic pyrophosphatase
MEQYQNQDEYVIDVFIEIPKNSHIKYEYDKTINAFRCDRILHTPLQYFFNYGFVQNTLSDDGDPIDVVVIMEDELIPTSYIKCKILGCLDTSDDEGRDPKIIACPISKIDPTYKNLNDISQIPHHLLDKIKYFFTHYKDLENKTVIVGDFIDKPCAISIYLDSIQKYKNTKVKTL